MVFGYTPLDPLVVLIGTAMAAWFLIRKPIRLMAYMPAALSLYFFIPTITLMTLWQTIPLLLTGRVLAKGTLKVPSFAKFFVFLFGSAFVVSATYSLFSGDDRTRAIIRVIYYLGIFALFSFSYEMGRRPEGLRFLLKGLAAVGVVFSVYGLYQLVATPLGLPVRGILRGTYGADIAYEYGFVRINSLTNEPKRLGYVLFCSALACFALSRLKPERAKLLRKTSYLILFISLFTFSGSYFLSIVLFGLVAVILYPSRATPYALGLVAVLSFIIVILPDNEILEAIQHGYERRAVEVEIGIDGRFVYRQEFYAWDYLAHHPSVAVTGVGLGQYFVALNQEYGIGVGINEYGGLVPLNSNVLELLFDLGGPSAALFYFTMITLIWKLRQAGERFLCLALLFVTMQSLSILTLQWMVLFAGVGVGRLAMKHASNPSGYRSSVRKRTV
ncbi:hypothetical protein [Aliiruegeria lutimaris]|uniref:O-antigen ligase n=1 Tax=Aliiruegeria lutimaris TaxID=571298 RepID=A0A1G9N7D2_9RHOB|nr:hypothetical protein [Aliiruegeria lutimaris]SDL82027.1 hypothetical protein SAMN04488026_11184 [Aliiruegeria lutimaris]